MAPDSAEDVRAHRSRTPMAAFRWVSSSPSPSEVSRLESLFPEVVQVPIPTLVEEAAGWERSSVLARSFSRWVPAEAYIREFRRLEIAGTISPVSLAFRCHIFRFEDPEAVELVLNRPWIINGQIIGMEAWHQEFIPAENSISSALVWMRLPCLPLEFWKEEVLRAITEQAGDFCCVDAATVSRTRGGFARVAVRVNLCRPLRPGIRVQGMGDPFWQPFVYESLEGFCPKCGSLHLDGNCVPVAMAEEEVSDGGTIFGPWMAAVRQRNRVEVPLGRGQKVDPAPVSVQVPGSSEQREQGGWVIPSRVGRRRPSGAGTIAPVCRARGGPSVSGSGVLGWGELPLVLGGANSAEVGKTKRPGGLKLSAKGKNKVATVGGECYSQSIVAVPVLQLEAGSSSSVQGRIQVLSAAASSDSSASVNPFAVLAMDSQEDGQGEVRVVGSGPLKRARPIDGLPPRPSANYVKRKGKGIGTRASGNSDLGPRSGVVPNSLCIQGSELGVKSMTPDSSVHLGGQEISDDLMGPGPSSMQAVSGAQQECSIQAKDSVMGEDLEVVRVSSS